jgi:hypothetical protein
LTILFYTFQWKIVLFIQMIRYVPPRFTKKLNSWFQIATGWRLTYWEEFYFRFSVVYCSVLKWCSVWILINDNMIKLSVLYVFGTQRLCFTLGLFTHAVFMLCMCCLVVSYDVSLAINIPVILKPWNNRIMLLITQLF